MDIDTLKYALNEKMPQPPEGADVFFAGRWVYPHHIVGDRQFVHGADGTPERHEFITWLGDGWHGAMFLARKGAHSLSNEGLMHKSSKRQFMLCEDEYGMIVGWPNGGYVHVVGWRKEDM